MQDIEGQLSAYQESLWVDWDESPPDHLYHYSSLKGLRGILESKTFWATDIRYMNDTTEESYAWNTVRNALANRRDILSTALTDNFTRHGGIPGFGVEWFRYAICFCGTRDLLSQWQGYTTAGEGVALSVPFASLRQYAGREFALIRVLYDPQGQNQMVNNFMDWALALWNKTVRQTEAEANEFLGNVGYILIEMMLRFKNPGFAQEDEWRVLLITWAQENQNLVRHRNRSGGQVPYIDWAFRPEYMDEVLIGPGPYGMNEEMPHEILAGCGMAHVPITHSTIPLR